MIDKDSFILSNFKKDNWFLILTFALISSTILIKSYYSNYGFLSPDSTQYLSLAQNLKDGNGFFTSNSYSQGKTFFALWPLGYPILIYLISLLTGISVFWASKLLNILFIGLILIIFKVLFKNKAYLYALIFLLPSFIEIFTYTWSETAFIFGLTWFSASLYFIINKNNRILLVSLSILLSSIFVFLSRYIGVFTLGFIGLIGIYEGILKRNKIKGIILFVIALINFVFVTIYLFNNVTATGHLTGMPRIPAPETNIQLIKALLISLINEINVLNFNFKYFAIFLLVFINVVLISAFVFKKRLLVFFKTKINFNSLQLTFGLIGILYLLSIIVMRWNNQFDIFGARLIGPGTFLIFIAFFNFAENNINFRHHRFYKLSILLITFSAFIVDFQLKTINKYDIKYVNSISTIKIKYDRIPKNSIVIFGNEHIRYLRPDIFIEIPKFTPYHEKKESWKEFINRIGKSKHIFLDMENTKSISEENFDKSIIQVIDKFNNKQLNKDESSIIRL